jgi:hypothetical protein
MRNRLGSCLNVHRSGTTLDPKVTSRRVGVVVEVKFHAFLITARDRVEWLGSLCGRLCPHKAAPETRQRGIYAPSTSCLHISAKVTVALCLLGIETRTQLAARRLTEAGKLG